MWGNIIGKYQICRGNFIELKEIIEGWSKWQIATAVGAPIALGLAELWFYKRRNSVKKSDEKSDKIK